MGQELGTYACEELCEGMGAYFGKELCQVRRQEYSTVWNYGMLTMRAKLRIELCCVKSQEQIKIRSNYVKEWVAVRQTMGALLSEKPTQEWST